MHTADFYKRKFPRIGHLPWSKGRTADDIDAFITDFQHKEIIITEKLDGENTVIGPNYYHARSMDSGPAAWRTMIAALYAKICSNIQPNMRICGENMYAEHSIKYALKHPFYVFMITEGTTVLSWDDTVEICEILDLPTVPVIARGKNLSYFDIHEGYYSNYNWGLRNHGQTCEGYVIRNAKSFDESTFEHNYAKYVRENHLQTDEHWTKNWKPNNINTLNLDVRDIMIVEPYVKSSGPAKKTRSG